MYSNLYSTPRQINFVQRQLSIFRHGWLIAAAAVFGLLFIISILTTYFNPTKLYNLKGMYTGILFLGGLVLTSQMFQELHAPSRSWAYLTLPVSTLEKLIGAWLLSSPLFILAYTAITFAIYLFSTLIAGFSISPFSYFSYEYWDTITSYMVVQTIFLWGAAYFRKLNFLKTLLVLVVLPIILGIYGALLGWLLFEDTNIHIGPDTTEINGIVNHGVVPIFRFMWYALFGPYMLLTTYFTLKERQV